MHAADDKKRDDKKSETEYNTIDYVSTRFGKIIRFKHGSETLKRLKISAAILLIFALLCSMAAAFAEEPEAAAEPINIEEEQQTWDPELLKDERFSGKTWDEVVGEFIRSRHFAEKNITLGYYNTVTGEEQYFQPDQYMYCGSLYKVPLNMIFTERIANGEMAWDDQIRGIAYERMLESVIVHSNNEWATYQWKALGDWGAFRRAMAPYMGADPDNDPDYMHYDRFTARQMITCLRTLYEGGEDRFPRVLEFMGKAEPNNYFCFHKQDYPIAHKYGWIEKEGMLYVNDSAVCYTDDPICIVMFNRQTGVNVYEVLADYCTLMCGYAQYTRAVRLQAAEDERLAEEAKRRDEENLANLKAAEERAAQAAQEEAMETAVPEETPVQPQQEETITMNQNVEAAVQAPNTGIITVIIAAVTVLLVIAAVIMGIRHKLKIVPAIAAALCIGLAMYLCVFAAQGASLASVTKGDPQETVTVFMNSMLAGDYEMAYSCLADYADLGLSNAASTPEGQKIYDALRKSYAWEMNGECRTEDLEASQSIRFTYLDLRKMQAALQTETDAEAARLLEELPQEEVYNDDNSYREEFIQRSYANAVDHILADASEYYTESEVTLQLTYNGSSWKVNSSNALLSALCGGIST